MSRYYSVLVITVVVINGLHWYNPARTYPSDLWPGTICHCLGKDSGPPAAATSRFVPVLVSWYCAASDWPEFCSKGKVKKNKNCQSESQIDVKYDPDWQNLTVLESLSRLFPLHWVGNDFSVAGLLLPASVWFRLLSLFGFGPHRNSFLQDGRP